MIEKLIKKHKKIIIYVFFGVCTTGVNAATYLICSRWIHMNTLGSTVTAWLTAVLFAYLTNRKYVFESKNTSFKAIAIEIISFMGCRLATGVIDVGIMYIFVDLLKYNDFMIKLLSNVLVTIINYIASRLIIFRTHKLSK